VPPILLLLQQQQVLPVSDSSLPKARHGSARAPAYQRHLRKQQAPCVALSVVQQEQELLASNPVMYVLAAPLEQARSDEEAVPSVTPAAIGSTAPSRLAGAAVSSITCEVGSAAE
jgi:hypothetical protein